LKPRVRFIAAAAILVFVAAVAAVIVESEGSGG
jgi:hypothetical protein